MAFDEPTYVRADLQGNADALNLLGGSSRNLPLKVKKTFIDMNFDLDEDDLSLDVGRRHVSEPAPRAGMNATSPARAATRNIPGKPIMGGEVAVVGGGTEPDVVGGEVDGFDVGMPTPFQKGGSSMDPGDVPLPDVEATAQLGKLRDMLEACLSGEGDVTNSQPRDGATTWSDCGLPPDDGEQFDLQAAAASLAAASDAVQLPPPGFMAALDPNTAPPPEWACTVTVMMRNIPNKYTQKMLLEELNRAGFLGTFDFLYLPIDPETVANRGYAFLNFIDPSYAWLFKVTYEGQQMKKFNSHKVVSVTPATLQGFEANYAHYSSARVNRGDPSARPLFLRPAALSQNPPVNNRTKGVNGKRIGATSQWEAQQAAQAEAHAVVQQHDWFLGAAMGGYLGMDCNAAMGGMDALDGMSRVNGGISFGGPIFDSDKEERAPPARAPKGAAFAPPPRAPKGTAPFAPKFCPNCGSPTKPDFRFCPNCGNSLDFSLYNGRSNVA